MEVQRSRDRALRPALLLALGVSLQFTPGEVRAQNKDAGMLTDATGTVKIRCGPHKAWEPGRLMMLLHAGDLVQIGKSSAASVVFFSDGHTERLLTDTLAQLSGKTCTIRKGSRTTIKPTTPNNARVLLRANQQFKTWRSGGITLRGGDEDKSLNLRSLSAGKTLSTRPVFRWAPFPKADGYVVVVLDNEANKLWQVDTTQCELPYPDREEPLLPGEAYSWRVTALLAQKKLVNSYANFEVLSSQEAEQVEKARSEYETMGQKCPEDATPDLLLAALYQSHNLFDDAIACYEQLLKRRPKDPEIQKALETLYRWVGRDARGM